MSIDGQFSQEFSDETIPIHVQIQYSMYRQDGKLFIHPNAELPNQVCMKCGKRARHQVTKALRNPYNPLTWFGGQPKVVVGLCRKHREDFMIAKTLTFSILGIGLILAGVGIATTSIGTIVVGALAILSCGVFRAKVPIWSPDAKGDTIEIVGAGPRFQKLFPEVASEPAESMEPVPSR